MQRSYLDKEYEGSEVFVYDEIGPFDIVSRLSVNASDVVSFDKEGRQERLSFPGSENIVEVENILRIKGLNYSIDNNISINTVNVPLRV